MLLDLPRIGLILALSPTSGCADGTSGEPAPSPRSANERASAPTPARADEDEGKSAPAPVPPRALDPAGAARPRPTNPPAAPDPPDREGTSTGSSATSEGHDAAPVAAPNAGPIVRAEPRVRVGPLDPEFAANDDSCHFDVSARGLPAIREDGLLIAYSYTPENDLSDDPPVFIETLRVREGTETWDGHIEILTEGRCRAVHRAARREAKRINAKFAEQRWRALVPLDVSVLYQADKSDDYDEVPPAERPVVLHHRHEQLVIKIPGVKVLMRQPAPWSYGPSEFCDRFPHFEPPLYDPVTRKALLMLSYNQADLCEHDGASPELLDIPHEVFDAIAARTPPP